MHPILKLCSETAAPILLGEGRREITLAAAARIADFAEWLATRFPTLTLRSGNAPGSDDAFVRGFARVAPSRIELVIPHKGHRAAARVPGARVYALDAISTIREEELAAVTARATPKNAGLIFKRITYRRLKPKADYLIRDTLKVLGDGAALRKPDAALFWVNPDDPESGGTGHTIRVCRKEDIPFATQTEWLAWPGMNPTSP